MDTRLHAEIKERNSLWFWLVSIAFFALGLLLIFSTEHVAVSSRPWLEKLIGSTGAALAVAAFVSLAWELFAKRKFADELFTIADVSYSVKHAGILDIHRRFYELPWTQLFEESTNLTVFIAYGRTWRNTNRMNIKQFLSRSKRTFTLLLPDPADEATMNELARRFKIDAAEMKQRVREAVTEYRDIAREAGGKADTRLKILMVKGMTPTATYYLFDNAAIITTYPHSKEKKPIPAFVVGKGGDLYEYVLEEINSIQEAAHPEAGKGTPDEDSEQQGHVNER